MSTLYSLIHGVFGIGNGYHDDNKFRKFLQRQRLKFAVRMPKATGLLTAINQVFADGEFPDFALSLWIKYCIGGALADEKYQDLVPVRDKISAMIVHAVTKKIKELGYELTLDKNKTYSMNTLRSFHYLRSVAEFLNVDNNHFQEILGAAGVVVKLLILIQCVTSDADKVKFVVDQFEEGGPLSKDVTKILNNAESSIQLIRWLKNVAEEEGADIEHNPGFKALYNRIIDQKPDQANYFEMREIIELHLSMLKNHSLAPNSRARCLQVMERCFNNFTSSEDATFDILGKFVDMLNVRTEDEVMRTENEVMRTENEVMRTENEVIRGLYIENIDILLRKLSLDLKSRAGRSRVFNVIDNIGMQIPCSSFGALRTLIEKYLRIDPSSLEAEMGEKGLYAINILKILNQQTLPPELEEMIIEKIQTPVFNDMLVSSIREDKGWSVNSWEKQLTMLSEKHPEIFKHLLSNIKDIDIESLGSWIKDIMKYGDKNKDHEYIISSLLQKAFSIKDIDIGSLGSWIKDIMKYGDKNKDHEYISSLLQKAFSIVEEKAADPDLPRYIDKYMEIAKEAKVDVTNDVLKIVNMVPPHIASKILSQVDMEDNQVALSVLNYASEKLDPHLAIKILSKVYMSNNQLAFKVLTYLSEKLNPEEIRRIGIRHEDVGDMIKLLSNLSECTKKNPDGSAEKVISTTVISTIINTYEPVLVACFIGSITGDTRVRSELLESIDRKKLSASAIEKIYFSDMLNNGERSSFLDDMRGKLSDDKYALKLFEAKLDLARYNNEQRKTGKELYQRLNERRNESVMEMASLLNNKLFPEKVKPYFVERGIEPPNIKSVRKELKKLAMERILASKPDMFPMEDREQWGKLQKYVKSNEERLNFDADILAKTFPHFYDTNHLALILLCQDEFFDVTSGGENLRARKDLVTKLCYAYACALDSEKGSQRVATDLSAMDQLLYALAGIMRSNSDDNSLSSNRRACPEGAPGHLYAVFMAHPQFMIRDTPHHQIREEVVPNIIAEKVQKEFKKILNDTSITDKASAMRNLCACLSYWSSDQEGIVDVNNKFADEKFLGDIATDPVPFLKVRTAFMTDHFPNGYKDFRDAVEARLVKSGWVGKLSEIDEQYLKMQFECISDSSVNEIIYRSYTTEASKLGLPDNKEMLKKAFSSYKTDASVKSQGALLFSNATMVRVDLQKELLSYLRSLIYSDPKIDPFSEATKIMIGEVNAQVWTDIKKTQDEDALMALLDGLENKVKVSGAKSLVDLQGKDSTSTNFQPG